MSRARTRRRRRGREAVTPRAGRGPRRRRRRHHHATVDAGTLATAQLVSRRPGVVAGLPVAAHAFAVVGQGRLGSSTAAPTARRVARRAAGHRPRTDARPAHRRAHRAELPRSPLRRRLADPALGGRGRGHRGAHPRHPQDHAGLARRWRSTRCAAAAASTTACRCRTRPWSRTTTSSRPAAWSRAFERVRAALSRPRDRDRGRHAGPGARGDRCRRRPRPARQHGPRRHARRGRVRGRPGAARGVRRPGLENARAVAETGVDYLSVGALTHSAPVLDIGLDI